MYTAVPAVVAGYPLPRGFAGLPAPGHGRRARPRSRAVQPDRAQHPHLDARRPRFQHAHRRPSVQQRLDRPAAGPGRAGDSGAQPLLRRTTAGCPHRELLQPRHAQCPCRGARYALLPPGAPASLAPAGTQAVPCPSALVWLLGRVIVDGAMDLSAARAVQEGFVLHGTAVGSPSLAWGNGPTRAMLRSTSWPTSDRALQDFPPPAALRAPLEMLSGLLPAGRVSSGLRPLVVDGLRGAWREAMALIEAHTHAASRAPWRFSTRLGRFGQDHMLRAAGRPGGRRPWPPTRRSMPPPTTTSTATCCMDSTRSASASPTAAQRTSLAGPSRCTAKIASCLPLRRSAMRSAAAAAW